MTDEPGSSAREAPVGGVAGRIGAFVAALLLAASLAVASSVLVGWGLALVAGVRVGFAAALGLAVLGAALVALAVRRG